MTADEFVIAIVDKELKLVNAEVDALEVLYNPTQNRNWFNKYSFKTINEYIQWRTFCYQTMRQYIPCSTKTQRYNLFSWINLQYGLKYDFDFNLIPKYEKHKLQFKKNFENSEERLSMS